MILRKLIVLTFNYAYIELKEAANFIFDLSTHTFKQCIILLWCFPNENVYRRAADFSALN